jgi:hypothetical protein
LFEKQVATWKRKPTAAEFAPEVNKMPAKVNDPEKIKILRI